MCFSTSTRIVNTIQLSVPTIVFFVALVDVNRQEWLRPSGTWIQSFFARVIGLNFSRKTGILPEMGISSKKDLHFLRRVLSAAFPWGESWVHAQCASNPPLVKWMEAYWCYFSVLVFPFVPLSPLPPKSLLPILL